MNTSDHHTHESIWLRRLLLLLLSQATPLHAIEENLAPDAVIVQAGRGELTETLSVGLAWHPELRLKLRDHFLASVYFELMAGRWRSEPELGSNRSLNWNSQLTLAPTLRLTNAENSGWFAEGGIGPSWVSPVYKSRDETFSTRFNFRDHLGVGYVWSNHARNEISLRIEHYSNGGVRNPNPGVNIVAIRFAFQFR